MKGKEIMDIDLHHCSNSLRDRVHFFRRRLLPVKAPGIEIQACKLKNVSKKKRATSLSACNERSRVSKTPRTQGIRINHQDL